MPMPSASDDDALADALADAWIAQAACNPVILREALRAAGLLPDPEELTPAELARQCGVSEGTVSNMVRMFRARLATEILSDPAATRPLITAASAFLQRL